MNNLSLRQQVQKRQAALENAYDYIKGDHIDLANFIAPTRTRFNESEFNQSRKSKVKAILDKEATLASRILAAGMMAGNTSPARPWFKLGLEDQDLSSFGPVKDWLYEVEVLMRDIFNRSNTYKVLPEIYANLGDFGTAGALVMQDFNDVIRLYGQTIGRYWLAQDDRGVVDTFYCAKLMTTAQIVKRFGLSNAGRRVQEAWRNGKLHHTFSIIHAIEPRPHFKAGSVLNTDMQVQSVYYVVGSDEHELLQVSGFNEFPGLFPRWSVVGGEVYGSDCPGMTALPAVKSLQLEQREKAVGIAKQANPPLIGPPELKTAEGSTLGGGITYLDVANIANVKPLYDIKLDLNALRADIEDVKREINRAYYVDLFRMISFSDRRQVTAREIEEKHEEKLLMLGPVLEQVQGDLLDPLIDRTFAIMARVGILPTPPEEIQGQDLKVEYIGVLAQAQKAVGLSSIERFTGFVSQLSAVKPEALDKFNADGAVDEYGNMLGVPPALVNSDEQAQEIRDDRLEQAAQQQMLDQTQQATDALSKAANANITDLDDVYST